MVTRTRISVTIYVRCLSCLLSCQIFGSQKCCSVLLLFRCEYANLLFLVYVHLPGINSDYSSQCPYVHTCILGEKVVDTLNVITTQNLNSWSFRGDFTENFSDRQSRQDVKVFRRFGH